jgi:hypothetical protein
VKDFLDSKCSHMKYVDIAKGCGLSVSFMYNLRAHDSGSHHMHTVLRVVYGLSGLLSEDVEDLFVEYILGEVLGELPNMYFDSVRAWVDHYKSEEMTYKDLCVRVGIDQTRMSVWFNDGAYPSDMNLRWLVQGMEGSEEEMCRSFFRVAIS